VTSSWFFLSTLNYDARSTTHQIQSILVYGIHIREFNPKIISVGRNIKKYKLKLRSITVILYTGWYHNPNDRSGL